MFKRILTAFRTKQKNIANSKKKSKSYKKRQEAAEEFQSARAGNNYLRTTAKRNLELIEKLGSQDHIKLERKKLNEKLAKSYKKRSSALKKLIDSRKKES